MAPFKPIDMEELFKEMQKRFREMNQFGESFNENLVGNMFPVDIEEEESMIVVKADMPGVSKDDIRLRASGDSLEISAKSEREMVEENEKYLRRERGARSYSRNINLPEEIKEENVEAKYENGVLEVKLPKKEKKKKTEIDIK